MSLVKAILQFILLYCVFFQLVHTFVFFQLVHIFVFFQLVHIFVFFQLVHTFVFFSISSYLCVYTRL